MCAELFLILFDFSERERKLTFAICRRKSASITREAVKFCVRKKMHAFAGGYEAYLQRYLLLIYRLSFDLPLLSLF